MEWLELMCTCHCIPFNFSFIMFLSNTKEPFRQFQFSKSCDCVATQTFQPLFHNLVFIKYQWSLERRWTSVSDPITLLWSVLMFWAHSKPLTSFPLNIFFIFKEKANKKTDRNWNTSFNLSESPNHTVFPACAYQICFVCMYVCYSMRFCLWALSENICTQTHTLTKVELTETKPNGGEAIPLNCSASAKCIYFESIVITFCNIFCFFMCSWWL